MSLDFGADPTKTASLGCIVRSVSGRIRTRARVDSEGATGQVSQINVTGAESDDTYEVRFRARNVDETVTVETGAGASQDDLRDAAIAAIEGNALLAGYADTVESGTNLAKITWKVGAPKFTVSFPTNPTDDLTLTNTAAADAPQYLYGRAAEVVSVDAVGRLITSGIRRATEIDGPVVGVDQTHAADADYALTLLIDGEITLVEWEAGGDAGATDTAAEAALEAALPTGTDVEIDSEGELTVSFTPGVQVGVVSATASSGALSGTIDSAGDSTPTLVLVADDRATAPLDDSATGYTGPAKGPYRGSTVLTASESGSTVWAVEAPDETPSEGDPVYVEADDSGDDRGRLFAEPSLTRIPWPAAEWVGLDPQDPTLAHVAL